MKPSGLFLIAIVCFCMHPAAIAQDADVSLEEYIRRLESAILAADQADRRPKDAETAARALPWEFTVRAGDTTFRIPMRGVRQALTAIARSEGADPEQAALRARLALMRAEALAFRQSGEDYAPARASLNVILARSEFRGVHGPSWLDLLRQRVLKLLGRLITSIPLPVLGNILAWALILAAIVLAAFLAVRQFRRRTAPLKAAPGAPPPRRVNEWGQCMLEARRAAERGSWREAVHLAYWAGIGYLESRGDWQPDRARTPREYLQLLPAAGETRQPLQALTLLFEGVWYGRTRADAASYAQARAELEKLGCR